MNASNADRRSQVSLPLFRGEEHDCPYLPDRRTQSLFTFPSEVDGATYQFLMDNGFRRSGDFFYRPDCFGCRACIPIRVPVERFEPSRSQRRALRKNADVTVHLGEPVCDAERWALYLRYQGYRHDKPMIGSRGEYEAFFCQTPIETIEMSYRIGGRLVGVGIVDACLTALSSVYFFFEPEAAHRSLGVFSALCEIQECRRRGLPYWYIGYFVQGCRTMDYKAQYRPHEFLHADGTWSSEEPHPFPVD